jgi:hypothetical protein
MLRAILATVAVLALAVPAAAYDTIWDFPVAGTDQDEDIYIYLELDCYIQIDWQDLEIHFDGTNDWWSETLMGVAYQDMSTEPGGKIPTDPWAGDAYYAPTGMYYESGDGAVIYVNSNNCLSMHVHSNGDLWCDPACEDCEPYTIPTWFTVALAPFYVAGTQITTGTIPLDGLGCYLFDEAGDFGYDDPAYNWPDQYAFPCDPASEEWVLGPLCPHVYGTIKFLARIHRHGMEDPGCDYATWLDVWFTTP